MIPDVAIGEVTTEVTVTDASSFLSPQTLERIVQAVLARLEEERENAAGRERDRAMGRG